MRHLSCDTCGATVEHSLELREIMGVDDRVVEVCGPCMEQLAGAGFFERSVIEQRTILSNLIEDVIQKRIAQKGGLN